jgi:hypothetical protein
MKLGRTSEIQVNLAAVSGDHCRIQYTDENGWLISEKGKSALSYNGTYFFVKSNTQKEEQLPSTPILLKDGMCMAAYNYEFHISLT